MISPGSSEASSGISTLLSSVISCSPQLPSNVYPCLTATHALDLPSPRTSPSFDELCSVLNYYAACFRSNFGVQDEAQIPVGFLDWLTRLVGSGLTWLADDEEREQVFELASKRIAEQCGRSAIPDIKREFYIEGLCRSIILKEPSLTADSLGLKTWGSSLLLAQKVAEGLFEISCKILELGAGTGLVGITLAALGYSVLLTDLPEILANLRDNVQSNEQLFLTEDEETDWDVAVEELDWTHLTEAPAYARGEKFGAIVLSDPVYQTSQPPMVVDVLSKFLDYDNPDAQVIIQLPLRDKFSDVRQMLWNKLFNELKLVPVSCQTEVGFDDFGEGNYMWCIWRPKSAVDNRSDLGVIEIDME
ncbi:putative methyltransferase-domain-containing protein [Kockiozyma suomiensis]|uniref:putative methyltransferase-domain-containing protein n=1 Tax=Kockiozyma suomiensis TaxID=1337062 RepID=UPI003344175A